jgi:hypothetical protein
MARSLLDDPEHWRARADDARKLAELLTEPMAKQTMLDIAADCEWLALRAEDRRANLPPRENSN